jgi:peroxiredoxin
MTIDIGDRAPEFRLKNQHGQDIALADFRGRPVVLVFFPFAFSGICTGELGDLRDHLAELTADGAEVLAISCDHFFANRAFADRDSYAFAILSDFWPHGAVARAYGIFNEEVGVAERGTFVVDREGFVRWTVRQSINEARDLDALREALAALG